MTDLNKIPKPDPKKAGKNGYDNAGYSKQVMVNASDVERSMLEVSLQCVRDNPDVRRPDGRKSPYMLCAEEAMRLRTESRAREQELETLRAQLRLALDERSRDVEIARLNESLRLQMNRTTVLEYRIDRWRRDSTRMQRRIADENDINYEQEGSRWFRLGRWMGFYR